jgi:hypothetical protein
MKKPTIESLNQLLAEQQAKLDLERNAHKAAQDALMKTHKQIEIIQEQIANVKYKETPPLEVDWKDLLMENMGQGRYNLMKRKWYEMWPHHDLTPEGYIPETGQKLLNFHLDKNTCTDQHLKDMEKILLFMIPFLIPYKDIIHFNITEPGLSEYNSYDIKYYPSTQVWSLREGRRDNKKEIFASNNTLIFLKYLAAHHAFNYSNDEDDN